MFRSLIVKLRVLRSMRRLADEGPQPVNLRHDNLGFVPMPWVVVYSGGRHIPCADVLGARKLALTLRAVTGRGARILRNRGAQ